MGCRPLVVVASAISELFGQNETRQQLSCRNLCDYAPHSAIRPLRFALIISASLRTTKKPQSCQNKSSSSSNSSRLHFTYIFITCRCAQTTKKCILSFSTHTGPGRHITCTRYIYYCERSRSINLPNHTTTEKTHKILYVLSANTIIPHKRHQRQQQIVNRPASMCGKGRRAHR